jgi:hypothetical protein
MNELEFLRSQLRLEGTHYEQQRALLGRCLQAVAKGEQVGVVTLAAAAYVVFALRRAVRRDHVHADQVESRVANATALDAGQRAMILAAVARSRADSSEAQAAVEALASGLQTATAACLGEAALGACHSFDHWAQRFKPAGRDALEPWFDRLYDVSDWRRVALTDAESVFEERRLHDTAVAAAGAAGLLA